VIGFLGLGLSSLSGLNSSEEAAWVEGSVGVKLALYGLHEGEGSGFAQNFSQVMLKRSRFFKKRERSAIFLEQILEKLDVHNAVVIRRREFGVGDPDTLRHAGGFATRKMFRNFWNRCGWHGEFQSKCVIFSEESFTGGPHIVERPGAKAPLTWGRFFSGLKAAAPSVIAQGRDLARCRGQCVKFKVCGFNHPLEDV